MKYEIIKVDLNKLSVLLCFIFLYIIKNINIDIIETKGNKFDKINFKKIKGISRSP